MTKFSKRNNRPKKCDDEYTLKKKAMNWLKNTIANS